MPIQVKLVDGRTEELFEADTDTLSRLEMGSGEFAAGWVRLANGELVRVEQVISVKRI